MTKIWLRTALLVVGASVASLAVAGCKVYIDTSGDDHPLFPEEPDGGGAYFPPDAAWGDVDADPDDRPDAAWDDVDADPDDLPDASWEGIDAQPAPPPSGPDASGC